MRSKRIGQRGKLSKVSKWMIKKGKEKVLNRSRNKGIAKESLEDKEYAPFIDSKEEESDNKYYTYFELLTNDE